MTMLSTHTSFGKLGNECIANKNIILSEIDKSLNCEAPDIEFIFAESVIKSNSGTFNKIKTFLGRFGHSAIRYKYYPDINDNRYQDIVMNIVGNNANGTTMINFIPTKEYFFGTNAFDKECEQGGIYNRTFYGLRIQNVSKSQLKALHYHFKALQYREQANNSTAKLFKLFGGRISSFFHKYMPFESDLNNNIIISQSGNCSMWTSSGLIAAGLIPRKRIFPKAIFVELYERQFRINPNNIKIVKYEEINHCYKYWKGYVTVNSFVNPLLPIRNIRYWNLDKICDVFVRVPQDSKQAIVIKSNNVQRPSVHFIWRNLNTLFTAIVALYIPTVANTTNERWIYACISLFWIIIHYWIY
eukprot:472518_1